VTLRAVEPRRAFTALLPCPLTPIRWKHSRGILAGRCTSTAFRRLFLSRRSSNPETRSQRRYNARSQSWCHCCANAGLLPTVSRIEGDTTRVTVVPQPVSDTGSNALITPLAITGTAEELDRELPQQRVEFAGAHLQLQTTLASAKAEMEAGPTIMPQTFTVTLGQGDPLQ
jgi:PRTRC genetic system protein E